MKPKGIPGVGDTLKREASTNPYNAVEVKIELNEVSNLVGQLLTLADASYSDKQQREGVKSLIKQIVWTWGKDWHHAATEEQIQAMEADSELIDDPGPQIPHLDD